MGRPTKGEILRMERANNLLLVESFKREEKRKERQKEKKEVEGLEAFKKNTRVERSPVRKEEEGHRKGNESEIQGDNEEDERTEGG